MLQSSHWGMLCASDTPEGAKCGLTKNIALLTHITIDEPTENILSKCLYLGLEDVGMIPPDFHTIESACLVLLNGQIIGIHSYPNDFVKNLRRLRRRGLLNKFISISFNKLHNEIWINSDFGRICRPLIIVNENGVPMLKDEHIEKIKSQEW